MKKYVFPLLMMFTLLMTVTLVYGQEEYHKYFNQSLRTQKAGMYVLGSWALVNMASGAYGWYNYSGEKQYFHQMNLFWNTVNLTIAGVALYNHNQLDILSMSYDELLHRQLKAERILLINTGLDIVYIGGGFLMRSLSDRYPDRSDLLRGYGNSVILQGSFLFVFDLVLYGILRTGRMQFMENFSMGLLPEGLSLQYAVVF